ncbi:porin [Catenovulum sp. SM1970]|uniref:porin n=1 Tax=Marinifaba aquimaris TaxID=2741323 RepID=UPI00157296D9|nr:porin [Marinifaba aquimaris]NTS78326.1 porin [Marinifaba aquimaris]
MKKLTPIALAVSALLSTSAFAQQQDKLLTIYGKANVGFQVSDEGNDSYTDVESYASRLGVKGEYKLEDGLTAFYKFEMQVNIDDKEDNLTARNQFVGLKGGFGSVFLGRSDTPFKLAQGKIDLFSDYEGDVKALWKGENRLTDSVNYTTPSFGGLKVSATYIAEGEEGGQDGVSIAAMYGDKKLKKSKFFAAVAADSDVKGYDSVRASLQGKLGNLTLGGMVQQSEEAEGDEEISGVMVSASYPIGKLKLKAQVQTAEYDVADFEKTSATLGADYKLGKMTKVFLWGTSIDNDDDGEDESYFSLGFEHKF